MVLTELLNLKLKCFPRKWRTQIFVHQTLISRAVSEGEDHFNRFSITDEGKGILKEFVSYTWKQDRNAETIYSMIKTFESNTDNIRSKFLSLNPAEIVIDEVMKPDRDGNFQVNLASRVLDLQLVMYMITASKISPVNDNGDSITFESSDELSRTFVVILEKLLEKLLKDNENAYKESDGTNIFQHLIQTYNPDVKLSNLRRLVHFCLKGKEKINMRNSRGKTVLHLVQDAELCEFLISESVGAAVEVQDNLLMTPLHAACAR